MAGIPDTLLDRLIHAMDDCIKLGLFRLAAPSELILYPRLVLNKSLDDEAFSAFQALYDVLTQHPVITALRMQDAQVTRENINEFLEHTQLNAPFLSLLYEYCNDTPQDQRFDFEANAKAAFDEASATSPATAAASSADAAAPTSKTFLMDHDGTMQLLALFDTVHEYIARIKQGDLSVKNGSPLECRFALAYAVFSAAFIVPMPQTEMDRWPAHHSHHLHLIPNAAYNLHENSLVFIKALFGLEVQLLLFARTHQALFSHILTRVAPGDTIHIKNGSNRQAPKIDNGNLRIHRGGGGSVFSALHIFANCLEIFLEPHNITVILEPSTLADTDNALEPGHAANSAWHALLNAQIQPAPLDAIFDHEKLIILYKTAHTAALRGNREVHFCDDREDILQGLYDFLKDKTELFPVMNLQLHLCNPQNGSVIKTFELNGTGLTDPHWQESIEEIKRYCTQTPQEGIQTINSVTALNEGGTWIRFFACRQRRLRSAAPGTAHATDALPAATATVAADDVPPPPMLDALENQLSYTALIYPSHLVALAAWQAAEINAAAVTAGPRSAFQPISSCAAGAIATGTNSDAPRLFRPTPSRPASSSTTAVFQPLPLAPAAAPEPELSSPADLVAQTGTRIDTPPASPPLQDRPPSP
jgi:hypothetical protein